MGGTMAKVRNVCNKCGVRDDTVLYDDSDPEVDVSRALSISWTCKHCGRWHPNWGFVELCWIIVIGSFLISVFL